MKYNLPEYERELFDDVCCGLVKQGWNWEGGDGRTLMLFDKKDMAIKVFRQAAEGSYVVAITICYSAPPEHCTEAGDK